MDKKNEHFREEFMLEAIRLAGSNLISKKGGPFGAVVVKTARLSEKALTRLLQQTIQRLMQKLLPFVMPVKILTAFS